MSTLDITGPSRKPPQAFYDNQFKKGQSGNPAGRPEGARSKLNGMLLRKLAADFEIHGEAVIQKVRERKPEVYLQACVSLLPKQQQQIPSAFADLTDEELEQLEKFLKASRAKNITPQIDGSKT